MMTAWAQIRVDSSYFHTPEDIKIGLRSEIIQIDLPLAQNS